MVGISALLGTDRSSLAHESERCDYPVARDRIQRQYQALPAEAPVRLRKPTSNLFRNRAAAPAGQIEVSDLTQVIDVDSAALTADVAGMTTYSDLIDATLPFSLIPLCVPQLRTITLGGAVTGLGIESTSFRNGCPHESVIELDVLLGTGDIVTATATNQHRDLFFGFPNSYGSLGYALRLKIDLEPTQPYVELRHLPLTAAKDVTDAIGSITQTGEWDGARVDFLDGTRFSADETYLTLGRYVEQPTSRQTRTSDYTGQAIYYRSIQQRTEDLLTTHDYLWRWDTDWFWCSRAFGAQNPYLRPLWPRRLRRSDVYWKLVTADRRYGASRRLDSLVGRPSREDVIQDVEIPVAALGDFLNFFDRVVGLSPIWLCPLRQRDPAVRWPLYELDPDVTYINVGFWSSVSLPYGASGEAGLINRAIEAKVTELGGRKSLYSTAYYDPEEFEHLYGGSIYRELKAKYDPTNRFPTLYDKTVGRS